MKDRAENKTPIINTFQWLTVIKVLTILTVFIFFFISYLQRPVNNYDFWWHLATGKYIVENASLPDEDPFAYTSHEEPSHRKSLILKGYWLAQIIFYKLYALWNVQGIIPLRSTLMTLFLFFIFLTVKKQAIPDLLALLITGGVFLTARSFLGERPQLFTFLGFSMVLFLLEDFRIKKSKKIFFIPLIVLILSNMHPGFIVCLLLIAIYIIAEAWNFLGKRASGNAALKMFSIMFILSAIAGVINPNGLNVLFTFFASGAHRENIVEFMPTFAYFKKYSSVDYSYAFFLSASLFSFRYLRKIERSHMILLIIFSIMSFVSLRYIIFYMAVAAPIIAKTIFYTKEEKVAEKIVNLLKRKELFLSTVSCITGIFLVVYSIPGLAKYKFREDTFFSVPQGAADFLSDQTFHGNMFNEYGLGGYLIWRLHPGKKVFIDGRSLESDIYEEYQTVAEATTKMKRSWEDIVKKYDITYIIMQPLMPLGEIYPIVETLFEREEWALIYQDHMAFIFLKKDARNMDIIRKFDIEKTKGLNTIIVQTSARALINKTNPYFLKSLGKVFWKTGRLEEAQKAFVMALQRDPNNASIQEWLRKVETARIKK
jgi:hypothetical protein